ncbi:1-aminocyclopropane-1-carboxylate synthase-like protein 1 [Paramyrothecium foliicola]|nr:1-aminocyclopropane-1-carboxylate synthase-like protein 1 [Paramyrothecium foliicola]
MTKMSETPTDEHGAQSHFSDIVDIGSSVNDIMLEDVEKWLKRKIKRNETQKCLRSDLDRDAKELRTAVASFANVQFQARCQLKANNVLVGTNIESLLDALTAHIAHEGDTIIVPSTFEYNINPRDGVDIVQISRRDNSDDKFLSDLEASGFCNIVGQVKDQIQQSNESGRKVTAIFITNLSHKLRSRYCAGDLEKLASLAFSTGARLIVDETNALGCGAAFNSVLSLDLEKSVRENVQVLWGLSKDFGLNGLQTGFAFAYDQKVCDAMKASRALTQESSFNALVSSKLLSSTKFMGQFLSKYQKRLVRNHERTEVFLKSHEIPYKASARSGSALVIDLSGWMRYFRNGEDSAEGNFKKYLANRKVSLTAETTDSSERSGIFLVNYGTKAVDNGLKRLVAALGELDGTTRMIEYDYRSLRETSRKSIVLQLH